VNGGVFGGDTGRITVAGTFHGSIALSATVTSPKFLRKGQKKDPLAQRVILHGGVGTGRWTVDGNPLLPFTKLAGMSDCLPKTSIEDIVSCLQDIPAQVLLKVRLVEYCSRCGLYLADLVRHEIGGLPTTSDVRHRSRINLK